MGIHGSCRVGDGGVAGCGVFNYDYAMMLSADDPVAALRCARRRQLEFIKRGREDKRGIEATERGQAVLLEFITDKEISVSQE